MLNNFSTEIDGQKVSADHFYIIGVGDSIGDVISGLPRPIMAETTSDLFSRFHKILQNSQAVGDRPGDFLETTNSKLRSANRMVIQLR
jgi:hypothetical protein